jgi:phosphatidylserine/phosphatidylglycerophosphate/cardiolipin synthase-like enzyme
MPISWKGNIEQYAGRLHRKYRGKEDVIIYDYVDFHVNMLENMYHKRLSRYAKLGYEISNITDNSKIKSNQSNSIYTNENYTKAFEEDLQNAENEIIIASPYMAKNRVKDITKIVLEVMVKGVKVAYATKCIDDAADFHKERLEELHLYIESNAIKLLLKESFYQKCAVIDRKIIWFGGVNLLANGKDGECIMRISDQVIARELLEDIL